MTFDEWYDANAKYMHPADLKAWMSEAWDAAILVEREACAKVCDELGAAVAIPRYYLEHDYDACAAAIRARSQHA